MSGHSKWATIKRKKATIDAKRGKEFTKLIKEITVAARAGGGDSIANPRLRLLLEKAKELNMPMDNTVRAIKRGTGEMPGMSYEEHSYEGYGPFGLAVVVDSLTDNKNRTVAEIRRLFTVYGGSLAETGSVNWMFARLGVLEVTGAVSEDQLLELLIDYEIKDISFSDGIYTVTCDPKALEKIKQILSDAGLKVERAELDLVAQNHVTLPAEDYEKASDFLSELEEHDDVQNIYTNLKHEGL
jgi:YebC/PmpR family DNA-binding regulatory protein